MSDLLGMVFIGIGATALMDVWAIMRNRLLGVPLANYGLVFRWIVHMRHRKFVHQKITDATPVSAENFWGCVVHYLIGIAFSGLLMVIFGFEWMHNPTLIPAMIIGVATVVAPLFFMQPGMGGGIAGSRTPNPNLTRLHSLIMHSVFGLGLYLSALIWHLLIA